MAREANIYHLGDMQPKMARNYSHGSKRRHSFAAHVARHIARDIVRHQMHSIRDYVDICDPRTDREPPTPMTASRFLDKHPFVCMAGFFLTLWTIIYMVG